ncbi:MAG: XRE family transcriptional regulator, partial [Lachnospiraceae bacterium]|nr:XRE family transcriptional regulator [Lachnospiraceae bacterium]
YNKVLQEEDYSKVKKENKVMNAVAPAYWLLVTAGYLTGSFLTGNWGTTWIVWPIAGILFGAIAAVLDQVTKN